MTTAQATTAPVETAVDAATAPVVAAAEKGPSKMAICEELYKEVFTPGYDLGGKSQRAVFIARAIAEKGMTKNGANTYYQNLSNAARGKGKYKYNKYVGKAGSKSAEAKTTAAPTTPAETGLDLPGSGAPVVSKADIKNAEALAAKTTIDLSLRWQVLDGEEVVNSFATRAEAKKAAVNGLTWSDAANK